MKNLLRITPGTVTQFPLGRTPIDGSQLACLSGALTSLHQEQHIYLPSRLKTLFEKKYHIVVFLLFSICFSTPAKAFDPYELQVYGYDTLGKGFFSPQLLNSFVPSGHAEGNGGTSGTYASQSMMRTAIELEYGLTDKIDFAAYLNFARPANETVQFAGAKARLRGRFAEKGVLPVDLGWYIEVEQWQRSINGDILEIEFKPTVQKDIGRISLIGNFPFEKVIKGDSKNEHYFEVGYLVEVSYAMSSRLRYGVQFIGGPGGIKNMDRVRDQQHYVMPVVHFIAPGEVRSTVGLGFGETNGSDSVLLKANFTFGGRGTYWD